MLLRWQSPEQRLEKTKEKRDAVVKKPNSVLIRCTSSLPSEMPKRATKRKAQKETGLAIREGK